MSTTFVLDNFRMAFIHDAAAFQVLGALFRSGPMTEALLAHQLGFTTPEIKDLIRRLYQAGLVNVHPQDHLSLSHYGEFLLAKTGIGDLTVNSLLPEAGMPSWKQAFLRAYVQSRSSLGTDQLRGDIDLLRSCAAVTSWTAKVHTKRPISAERLYFALLIGTDPSLKRLKPDTFCANIASWHSQNEPPLIEHFGARSRSWLLNLAKACDVGQKDAQLGERLLLERAPRSSRASTIIAQVVTAARILHAVTFAPDEGLLSEVKDAALDAESIVSTLDEWLPGYSNLLMSCAEPWSEHRSLKPNVGLGESLAAAHRLRRAFHLSDEGESTSVDRARTVRLRLLLEPTTAPGGTQSIEFVRRQLELAALAVEAGLFDSTPNDQKQDFVTLARRLFQAADTRFSASRGEAHHGGMTDEQSHGERRQSSRKAKEYAKRSER